MDFVARAQKVAHIVNMAAAHFVPKHIFLLLMVVPSVVSSGQLSLQRTVLHKTVYNYELLLCNEPRLYDNEFSKM